MHCEACRKELQPDAPVYRVSLSYDHDWAYRKRPGTIIRVCAACNVSPPLFFPDQGFPDRRVWCPRSPCIHCGRPIIASRKRRPPKLFCCSMECDAAALNAAARRKRRSRRTERSCGGCGKPFESKRINATFCSPACRQRAYRRRLGGSSRPLRLPPAFNVETRRRGIAGPTLRTKAKTTGTGF